MKIFIKGRKQPGGRDVEVEYKVSIIERKKTKISFEQVSDLSTGIEIFKPSVNDILLDVLVVPKTIWHSPTSQNIIFDFGQFQDGDSNMSYGILTNNNVGLDLANGGTIDSQGPPGIFSSAQSLAQSDGSVSKGVPGIFKTSEPLLATVTQDGQLNDLSDADDGESDVIVLVLKA